MLNRHKNPGGTRSMRDGWEGSDVFFLFSFFVIFFVGGVENLHARYFLGPEISHVFF